jgi:hypothetical protein
MWRVDVQTSTGEHGRSSGYVIHWCTTEHEARGLEKSLHTPARPAVAWDWDPRLPRTPEPTAAPDPEPVRIPEPRRPRLLDRLLRRTA